MSIIKISPQEISAHKPTIAQMRLRKRMPIYAVFENIRSLYNIGSMFRSSDAALVSKIFLTGLSGRPPKPEMDKSALGATDVVPWEYSCSAVNVIRDMKSRGISVVALELTHRSIPYFEMKYSFPACVVVGNEIDGISQEVLNICDGAVDIPMLGRANSLNVAVAYSIALFEILKQYKINA